MNTKAVTISFTNGQSIVILSKAEDMFTVYKYGADYARKNWTNVGVQGVAWKYVSADLTDAAEDYEAALQYVGNALDRIRLARARDIHHKAVQEMGHDLCGLSLADLLADNTDWDITVCSNIARILRRELE